MGGEQCNIRPDDMESTIRKAGSIASDMPEVTDSKLTDVGWSMSTRSWSHTASELYSGVVAFRKSYAELSSQAEGFKENLRAVLKDWEETERTHGQVFEQYGQNL